MTSNAVTTSPSIFLIADHLDAVLAHGEDLMAMPPPPEEDVDSKDIAQVQQRLGRQREFLEAVRTLETRVVTRVMRAREHAEQVRRVDGRFKTITDLFVSGTHVVADAAADLADSTGLDFNTGRDSMAFLRSRGMIPAEALTLPRMADLKICESFKLCGAIELGALLDLAAAYLDALELHYDLYGDAVPEEKAPKAATVASTAKPETATAAVPVT